MTICLSEVVFFVKTFTFNLEMLFVLEGERRVMGQSFVTDVMETHHI